MNFTDLENLKDITPEQVAIYAAIKNEQRKTTVMRVIIIAFFIILIVFILEIFSVIKSDWQAKTITGVLDGILGGTMYPLVIHFFPASSKAKAAEKSKVK